MRDGQDGRLRRAQGRFPGPAAANRRQIRLKRSKLAARGVKGEHVAIAALALAALALLLDPARRARGRAGEGRRLLAAGRHLDALREFDGALELDVDCAGAHAGRARSLLALRRNRKALAAASSAVEADPEDAGARSLVSSALLGMGRWDDAGGR